MTIVSTKVVPGCISCRNCENICPEIFKVDPKSQVISDNFNQHAIQVLMAEKMCPVQVIKVEKEGTYTLENPVAKLISKKYLTPDTIELIFSCQDFVFLPGQYVSLQMSDIRGDFSRSYSIASADSSSFTLTVKLLRQGRGSNFLRKLGERSWRTGWIKRTSLEYIGALGDFTLKHTPARKVMIATGTGLAPMMAMLEALPESVEKILVFGGRYESDLYYVDKINSFKNVELRICVSRPSQEFTGNKGRVTDYIYDLTSEDEVYICGNPDMVEQVSKTLKADGHKSDNIYHEDFTLAGKPSPFLKTFLFEGNVPGLAHVEKLLIYLGAICIPLLYFFASKYGFLSANIFGVSLYNLLFAISWYSVVFVMMIRPLADIFPKILLFRRLLVLRKGLGIISASVVVSVLLAKWIQNPFTFTDLFSLSGWNSGQSLIARLSELTAIILLLSSNNFSQKMLGVWWKRIQKSSYIYFVSGGLIAAQWATNVGIYYVPMICVLLLWLCARFGIKIGKI